MPKITPKINKVILFFNPNQQLLQFREYMKRYYTCNTMSLGTKKEVRTNSTFKILPSIQEKLKLKSEIAKLSQAQIIEKALNHLWYGVNLTELQTQLEEAKTLIMLQQHTIDTFARKQAKPQARSKRITISLTDIEYEQTRQDAFNRNIPLSTALREKALGRPQIQSSNDEITLSLE